MADIPFQGDPLLGRFFLTPEQKADPEQGRQIIKAIYTQQTSNDSSLNYFNKRNAKWLEILRWAKGSQPIEEFLGYMNISDANKAYLSIDTTQSRLGPQFVGTLVESMAKTKVYPCVKAIDSGSLDEKQQRMWDALYRMHEVQTIAALQNQAGMQLEPTNAYVPDDELAARVYFELQDKLPKEIRFEKMLSKTMNDINFENILNRKTLYDQVTLNCAALKIEKLAPAEYTIRKCIPTNLVYNFFINDNGECEITFIGEFFNLKVKDFRSRFGKTPDNPNGLDEKAIFNLAGLSSKSNIGTFNYLWKESWSYWHSYNQTRPYDDCNILVFDCEIDFQDELYYVEKTNTYGRVEVEKKNGVPYQNRKKDGTIIEQPKPDNVEIKKRIKNTWMRGVYAPYGDQILYWGAPDLIIPNYTNVYKPLSSYVINIPNNDGDYVPSLFERGMDCLRDLQLTTLKRRQIIALVEPDGWTIDIEGARNLDLGGGNIISWQEVVKIKNQTGVQLYSSKGIDPLQHEAPPITAGVQTNNIQKILELTNVIAGLKIQLRELFGVPQYRDGSDVGDRTAAALAEGQNTASYNVTDFVSTANNQLWSEAFKRLCLLHWNDIVKLEPESKDDLLNTRFDVKVEVKSSDYEKEMLEKTIQQYSQMPDAQGNPSISPKDAYMLREIGADNYKLASWYLTHIFESNRAHAKQDAQQMQAQAQQMAAQQQQMAQQADAAMQSQKLDVEQKMMEFKHEKEMQLSLMNSIGMVWSKSGAIDPQWMPVIQQLIPNVGIPIKVENQQMGQAVAMAAQQDQAQAEQQSGQAPPMQQGGQPMPPQGPPPDQSQNQNISQ